jgi:hypothetical protein
MPVNHLSILRRKSIQAWGVPELRKPKTQDDEIDRLKRLVSDLMLLRPVDLVMDIGRIQVLMQSDGWVINHKKICRICVEEELKRCMKLLCILMSFK